MMGTGIQICGLNGCGKSTLGRALAGALGYHFIDNEDLYFVRSAPDAPYANARTREEAAQLLMDAVQAHPDFVYAAVRGNPGQIDYDYVVVMDVPREVRLRRVRERSLGKFGNRMLPGGDLHEQEEAFFRMAAARQDAEVDQWLAAVSCPIIRVDGTKPIAENVEYIVKRIG